jgi:hypothetical protein
MPNMARASEKRPVAQELSKKQRANHEVGEIRDLLDKQAALRRFQS